MSTDEVQRKVEDLRTSLERVFSSGDEGAITALVSLAHEDVQAFLSGMPFRCEGRSDFKKLVSSRLGAPGEMGLSFYHQSTRIHGDTGIVTAYFQIDGATRTGVNYMRCGQFSATFVREGEGWQMVNLHTSPLLEGVDESGRQQRALSGLASLATASR